MYHNVYLPCLEEWTEADDDEEDPSALVVVVVKSITINYRLNYYIGYKNHYANY